MRKLLCIGFEAKVRVRRKRNEEKGTKRKTKTLPYAQVAHKSWQRVSSKYSECTSELRESGEMREQTILPPSFIVVEKSYRCKVKGREGEVSKFGSS